MNRHSFCSLEEAWGLETQTRPQPQPQVHAPQVQPPPKEKKRRHNKGAHHKQSSSSGACHLYDITPDPNIEDIYSSYHSYDKIPFSRTQAALPDTYQEMPRNDPLKEVNLTSDEHEQYFDSRIETMVDERVRRTHKDFVKRNAGLEFAAYVVSGLLLILILEQVMNIGMHMRAPF